MRLHARRRSPGAHLVLYLRRPGGQSQFSAALPRAVRSDSPIRALPVWILDHLEDDLRVERLAQRSAMSQRNFARVFTDEVGTTPARSVEELRLEAAKRRLENLDGSFERIAWECGFGSAVSIPEIAAIVGSSERPYARGCATVASGYLPKVAAKASVCGTAPRRETRRQ